MLLSLLSFVLSLVIQRFVFQQIQPASSQRTPAFLARVSVCALIYLEALALKSTQLLVPAPPLHDYRYRSSIRAQEQSLRENRRT